MRTETFPLHRLKSRIAGGPVFPFLMVLLLLPLIARGEPFLAPASIEAGGVALLRWQGELAEDASVRFNGREVLLRPMAGAPAVLLGADLDLPPGLYPVTVTTRDSRQGARRFSLTLEVRARTRPVERLTLPEEMVEPRAPSILRRIERERALLAKIYARDKAAPLWQDFIRPVQDPLGSPFGLQRILNGKPRAPHAGVDFRSSRGTPVHAPGRGEVAFAGDLYFTGGTVILDHGGGLVSIYAHLDRIHCAVGDVLEQGAPFGLVGSTGRSTGPHLHWGFKWHGARVDPLAILAVCGKDLDYPSAGGNN